MCLQYMRLVPTLKRYGKKNQLTVLLRSVIPLAKRSTMKTDITLSKKTASWGRDIVWCSCLAKAHLVRS